MQRQVPATVLGAAMAAAQDAQIHGMPRLTVKHIGAGIRRDL